MTLTYHDVVLGEDFDASGFPGPGPASYKLDVQQVAMHFRELAAFARPRLADTRESLVSATRGETPLFLTFDDGGVSAATRTADLLEERGWRGHFFITTRYVDSLAFLTRGQIRDLRSRGHVIGSHSHTHPARISELGADAICDEWSVSAAALSDILGEAVTCASVPGGFYSRRVAEAASRAGIEVLFTSEPTKRCLQVGRCIVLGRYAVRRGTNAAEAAALASTRLSRSQFAAWLSWSLKKGAKRMAGGDYERMRRAILGRRLR